MKYCNLSISLNEKLFKLLKDEAVKRGLKGTQYARWIIGNHLYGLIKEKETDSIDSYCQN